MRSLGTTIVRRLTLAIYALFGLAAFTAAVAVIGFTVVMVALHVWRSDPPKAAIGAIHCHWNGRYLVARGAVLNFGGHEATFDIRPEISVAGAGSLTSREDDFVSVKAGRVREWRWTNGRTGVPSGSAVRQCSARVFVPRGDGADGD